MGSGGGLTERDGGLVMVAAWTRRARFNRLGFGLSGVKEMGLDNEWKFLLYEMMQGIFCEELHVVGWLEGDFPVDSVMCAVTLLTSRSD
jgi:hypothetical protein